MTHPNVDLQIYVGQLMVHSISDPDIIPTVGSYIEVPDRLNAGKVKEVFVGKVLNVYPELSNPLLKTKHTLVKCECVDA